MRSVCAVLFAVALALPTVALADDAADAPTVTAEKSDLRNPFAARPTSADTTDAKPVADARPSEIAVETSDLKPVFKS